jgi:hypothetical protein
VTVQSSLQLSTVGGDRANLDSATRGTVAGGQTIEVNVTVEVADVPPAAMVSAVVLNVTAITPAARRAF